MRSWEMREGNLKGQNQTNLDKTQKLVRSTREDKLPSRWFNQLPRCPVPLLPLPQPGEFMGRVRKEKGGSLRTLSPEGRKNTGVGRKHKGQWHVRLVLA